MKLFSFHSRDASIGKTQIPCGNDKGKNAGWPIPSRLLRKGGVLQTLSLLCFAISLTVHAQEKGEPGKFDFYLLNVVPSTQFCAIKDVGAGCKAGPGWWLHGLWPQRFDGTYPAFCAERSGPREPDKNLDLTPDRALLEHEWAKHGTCTTLAPEAFFQAERRAFHALVIPPRFAALDAGITLAPAQIVADFERANPAYPHGSLIVWCSQGRLASISACLSKDLKPIACRGVANCKDAAIMVEPVR